MQPTRPSFELDERKKRILAIAGVATVALLFVSFLVSLTTDNSDSAAVQEPVQEEIALEGTVPNTTVKVPASVRYSYDAQIPSQDEIYTDTPQPDVTEPGSDVADESMADVQTEQIPEQNSNTLSPGIGAQQQFLSYLYCGSYDSDSTAQQEKAKIAFAGIISTVAEYKGTLTLKIGPFNNRDEARAKFSDLSEKGLLSTCELVDE